MRLQNGSLAVFSPTSLVPEVRTTVEDLGNNVQYLVALDYEHHAFLTEWMKAFPNAKLLGVEGLAEKRETMEEHKGFHNFHHVWTAHNKAEMKVDPDFDREFDYEYVDGHNNKELVMLYKLERTMIEADLFFNLPANEQYSKTKEGKPTGFMTTRIANNLFSLNGPMKWHRRLLWYGMSRPNRPSFNASMKRISAWDFDRAIPCHGDVIETGANSIFRSLMEWHINGAKS